LSQILQPGVDPPVSGCYVDTANDTS
jgi:hypothetical protein